MIINSISPLVAASLFLATSLHAGDQDISLNVGDLTATIQVPEKWGKGTRFTQSNAEKNGIDLRMPRGAIAYSGMVWNGVAPKWTGLDAAPGRPLLTVALVSVPAVFEDDEGSRLPKSERPEQTLTKEQKLALFAPLKKIYDASAVNVKHFRTKDGRPAKEFAGAWWGNDGFGTQNILDVQFLENADKSLRGILYFYTDASDFSFFVLSRILLYNPESRALLIMDLPLGTFPEAVALENAITDETKKTPGAFEKAVAFYRDRKAWADTPMGRVVAAMENAARSAKLN